MCEKGHTRAWKGAKEKSTKKGNTVVLAIILPAQSISHNGTSVNTAPTICYVSARTEMTSSVPSLYFSDQLF